MVRWVARLLGLLVACWFLCGGEPARGVEQDAPGQVNVPGAESESQAPPADGSAPATPPATDSTAAPGPDRFPLVVLGIGIAVVLGLIIVFKVNAFIALISAAMIVSLMAPGDIAAKISRVASAFGSHAGGIGIVIALAAVIGKCMLDSGAADRIVRTFLKVLGEKRSPMALMGSGFVLAVPVFFDTVFYLLVPLARSLHRSTQKQYLKYILAIAAGGAITHTLVPPTPGPLMMASNLGVDLGFMILVGTLVAIPAALAGLLFAGLADRFMPIPMRQVGNEPEPEPLKDEQLPSLVMSLLPVVLPVLLISTNTVLTTIADSEHAGLFAVEDIRQWEVVDTIAAEAAAGDETPGARIVARLPDALAAQVRAGQLDPSQRGAFVTALNEQVLGDKEFYLESAFLGVPLNDTAKSLVSKDRLRMKKVDAERMNRAVLESTYGDAIAEHRWDRPARKAANISALIGNPNLALLLSTIIALVMLVKQRGLSRTEAAGVVELSLMSAGVIILITAGGGAFGDMLKQAQVGDAIKELFQVDQGNSTGSTFLLLGFMIAVVLKVAQGSSTVAMITGSAMLASIASPDILGFHPVYLATAIGGGSLVGSWMNDSGFWIFTKMGGLTEVESLKSWTIMLAILGAVSLGTTMVLARLLPFVG